MKFTILLTDNAIEDLDFFRKNERKQIAAAIDELLTYDADVETRNRKPLRPNEVSEWELRVGKYRVFYDLDCDVAKIVAVGHKVHNELFIRGKKVEL